MSKRYSNILTEEWQWSKLNFIRETAEEVLRTRFCHKYSDNLKEKVRSKFYEFFQPHFYF